MTLRVCNIEPFVAESTPQPGSLEEAATAGEIFQQQLQGYLTRLVDDLCRDLTECCLYSDALIVVKSGVVDMPSIGSKNAVSIDIPVTGILLGTHVISWAPLTDATSVEDLMIQFFVPETGIVRVTMQNPTSGAVDPAPITFQFVLGRTQDTT